MAEWSNAPDSKSGLRATVTGVRIPLSPPVRLKGGELRYSSYIKKLSPYFYIK
jgi:hypothetical protein